jgi:N utilization substance protein B
MTPDTESPALPETPEDAFRLRRSCARAFAIQFLYQLDFQKSWSCTPEELTLFRENLGELDKGVPKQHHRKAWSAAVHMIEGVCAHRSEVDQLLSKAAVNWELSRMSGVDRSILRLGAYEIAFSEKVTAATAINEAIELAKKFGHADSPRFINGVLDKVRRLCLSASGDVTPNQ